jgi:hypothetical protein
MINTPTRTVSSNCTTQRDVTRNRVVRRPTGARGARLDRKCVAVQQHGPCFPAKPSLGASGPEVHTAPRTEPRASRRRTDQPGAICSSAWSSPRRANRRDDSIDSPDEPGQSASCAHHVGTRRSVRVPHKRPLTCIDGQDHREVVARPRGATSTAEHARSVTEP